MITTEPSVEGCLKELRETGFSRIRLEYTQIFDSDFPLRKRIEISIWRREQSGKVIYGPTLTDCMAQVRAWHKGQKS